ncbi:ATP-binding protein [Guptibacillus hwajinpoensis]|uniref:histidine kinase n=1 Tax=Guptibacillus hwajinpoensis TaxID=208199 RepID=A0ABU0K546_9BACL|nr:ATP-binding protein [Alkalihalobacillus hemicentroti]MDQ0483805.1 two-component system sporulation sensor kinase B [Alkalihalobacillus hemicentroti]
MLLTAKTFLLNLLLVFAPLGIMQILYLLKYTNLLKKSSGWLLALFPLLSVILCMTYPIVISDNFILDFRRIPFILGALYGGKWVGLIYLIVLLSYRYLLGGSGFYPSLYSFSIATIATSLISAYFLKLDLKKKLLVVAAMDGFLGGFGTFVSLTFFNSEIELSMWILFSCISVIGVVLATLIYEVFINQFKLLHSVMEGQKLKVVSHLAASISHEVRNPLTVSRGFLQLIDSDLNDREKKGYMKLAITELDRATEIINDYLTFAKPYPESVERIDIISEVKHSISVIQPLASMMNVSINAKIDLPSAYMHSEKRKFQQCLLNFSKNAIEAMSNGGTLTIQIARKDNELKISIQDTGVGMTKDQLSRIGEPFFTTKEKGTGLGMMVSHSIVKGMGGELMYESEPGIGTTVHLVFQVENVN